MCRHFENGSPVMNGQQDIQIDLTNNKLEIKAEESRLDR
ncbi:hypothetical protein L348_07553 [Enterobacter sp. MGH 2]|nr:hypothetical protein L354_01123 [Enterobacter sp. MGH 8]ESN11104.1 hypothetical protein L372_01327 [Enterobacter sp. MGH 26]EUM34448.1 hypothetical protein L407_03107 [Enterobacter sp. BWH 39]EUM64453.1 hypothetical protein L358_01744 [Enterobacter sp. MGH 12]EUM65723.1 hypothetical protein L357_03154 [Enterobacter sp. MGH 11]EUM76388.1 hypothetical protein L355_06533 [Enterobacter sp. MGH 9]EUM94518.1 hypothetical protein L351_06543 [Enterobacter sp. MGH 5]EUN04258.1 hypothetical protein